jgi:hypothetical protein
MLLANLNHQEGSGGDCLRLSPTRFKLSNRTPTIQVVVNRACSAELADNRRDIPIDKLKTTKQWIVKSPGLFRAVGNFALAVTFRSKF